MTVQQWIESEVNYGRKVLDAGLEGTRSGREAFLNGRSLTPILRQSFGKALLPAAIGACIGSVGSGAVYRRGSVSRILRSALMGAAAGFFLAIAWENRDLTASALSGALKKIGKVRDEHWFERHPIDYA
jgi:hypothetical protein